MKNHYFGAMKPNKETNKTVKVGKAGNVIFWIVVTLLSLGLLFFLIGMPIIGYKEYLAHRAAGDMNTANKWFGCALFALALDFYFIIQRPLGKYLDSLNWGRMPF